MPDNSLEQLRNAVDAYIQRAGTLISELRRAIEVEDIEAQKELLEALDADLDALKPELN